MKRVLYLGLDPSRLKLRGEITHLPLIETSPIKTPLVESLFATLPLMTHLLFTSRTAVSLYFERAQVETFHTVIAVGSATAQLLVEKGHPPAYIAKEECAEGVISLLESLDQSKMRLFYPRSKQARSVIPSYLHKKGVAHTIVDFYETCSLFPELPKLSMFETLVFTSPTIVRAFRENFGSPLPAQECLAIGPVTKRALKVEFDVEASLTP